jgi:Tfp pilus assembly pilus retraction ATPase PilT
MTSEEKPLQGDLKHFSIFDLTQSMMMGRKTALITVQHDHRKGFLNFEDGEVTAALDDQLQSGESAALNVFSWKSGRFKVEFGVTPRERNIKTDTQNLLLEVARQIDEHERDHADAGETDTTEAIQESLQDRFSTELNKIFDQVAAEAAPARDRYSVNAFDGLLLALTDLGATALFLRPNRSPRVKTSGGFRAIRDEEIRPGEIEAFLQHLLSEDELARFRRSGEATVHYVSERGDHYQVCAMGDGGRASCIFTPASKQVPGLDEIGIAAERMSAELDRRTGLILVTGPLASGKSTLLASLIEQSLDERDRFVALFARSQTFDYSDDRGFLMRCDLGRFHLGSEGGLSLAIDQGADLVAVDEVVETSALHDALAAAARATLVVAVIESEGRADLAERLGRQLSSEGSDRHLGQLSRTLIGIADIDLSRGEDTGLPRMDWWTPDDADRERLARGDLSALSAARPGAPSTLESLRP